MTDKKKIHQILSSLWKNDDSVGKVYYNQALQDVQTAVDLQEESVNRTPADVESAMQEVEEKSRVFTEAHQGENSDTILAQMRGEEPVNKQKLSNVEKTIKDWKEESVSNPIDFEKEFYKAFGQVKDFTFGMRIAKWFYNMGKKSREPESEELEEEIVKRWKVLHGSGNPIPFDTFNGIACHFATWQKQQDQSTIELAEDHAMLAGMEKMKEQMMKDAIEAEIINWASMFTSIKVIEPERAETMIKEKFDIGDKVKLIIVKED